MNFRHSVALAFACGLLAACAKILGVEDITAVDAGPRDASVDSKAPEPEASPASPEDAAGDVSSDGPSSVDGGSGKICESGTCVPCDSTSCPNGCCDSTGCVTQQTIMECGTGAGGGACRACSAPSGGSVQCMANNCVPQCESGTACGTTCVDTTSNANNCGACGHSCRGAGCVKSQCQAIDLIVGYQPLAIAVDTTQIYWTNLGSTEAVFKASLTSPGSTLTQIGTPLTTAIDIPMGLALANGNVYWNSTLGSSGSMYSVPTTSTGTVASTMIGSGAFNGIAADPSGNVYWTASGGTITKWTKSTATAATLYSVGSGEAYGIVADATNVYWTDMVGGFVYSVPSNGTGNISTLASSQSSPAVIAIDAVNAYFLVTNTVMSVPLAGTSPAKSLATDTNISTQESGIAADGTYVYWSDGTALMRVPVGGGTANDMGVGAAKGGVTVDSNYVYFVGISSSNLLNLEKVAR